MSSLVAQLAQAASLNSALLVDRSRRKASESYLFTGADGDIHDLESIYALGGNGLLQLTSVDPEIGAFEQALFSDASKETDRTLLPLQDIQELDRNIDGFLARLGPYLMEAPTSKVLEWLVKRFRINEFNVESVLTLFLPYHESPHFAKMVTILHLKPNSMWDFLIPFQKAAQSVPRLALVKEMLKNSDLTRSIANLLPTALKSGHSHRTLLAFNAATIHDYLAYAKIIDDGTVAHLLPAILQPLQKRSDAPKDAVLGSYILLAALSHKCDFSSEAVTTIMAAMITSAKRVSTRQFLNAILSVCEAQDELDILPAKTVTAVMRISSLSEELNAAVGCVGIEKFLNPLLAGLTQSLENPSAVKILEAILVAPNPPKATLVKLTSLLLGLAVDESQVVVTSRRLLQHVHQRYPDILHVAIDKTSQADEGLQSSLEQLIVSLSMNQSYSDDTDKDSADMLIAATSADSKVRVIATKNLLAKLEDKTLSEAEDVATRSALLARTQDQDVAVVEALYSKPSITVSILLAEADKYITELANLLSTSKPKRPLLKAHLQFLTATFCPKAGMKDVFHKILFPLMLCSKPRQHSAELVWDCIEKNVPKTGAGSYELLNGCAELWAAAKADIADAQDRMAAFNITMASRIAENILASNDFGSNVDELVPKLNSANTNVRLLACIVSRALLRRLTGGHQVDTALKIVQALDLDQLSTTEDSSVKVEELREHIDDEKLGKSIVAKPNSKNTLYWVQVSLVTIAADVPSPEGLVVNWLMENTSTDVSDDRDIRYVTLMRAIYKAAVTSTAAIMMNTLSVLFATIQDDALSFLTGIWLGSFEDEEFAALTLGHCVALLEAFKESPTSVDFQTVLPSLLVALQSPSLKTREQALKCLALISESTQRKFERVYAFDVVYGSSTAQLLYLSQDDLTKYVAALVAHREHYLHDSRYVIVFHQEYLSQVKSDKRKTADHKRSVVCCLASHINAAPTSAQYWLLKIVTAVEEESKATALQPCIKQVLSKAPGQQAEEFVGLVTSLFDATSHKDLNADKEGIWTSYCDVVSHLLKSGHSAGSIVVQNLKSDLFKSLTADRQFDLCDLLLELSNQGQDVHSIVTKLLVAVLTGPSLIVQLLQALQPDPVDAPPAMKRARVTAEPSEDTLPKLSVLAEVLSTASLPGSFDLIVALVQTLNNVIQASATSDVVDVVFIEQSLMSAVANVADKVSEAPNLSPGAIRLEVLVDLIRTANNPQTFQQALLLMATLARLSPESVLHNIMPVFTFMGSNVFHRDDTYSFTVVQKTIDNIVPVMVASLKNSHKSRMELLLASRDFLRVFSDAANHIPRHRRTNFFVHLVNVLGPDDYLLPVCLLLVEKAANRVVRQTAEEAKSTFALPISVLHHYDGALQNEVFSEMVLESQRLARRVTDPENLEPTFMDDHLHEEHSTSVITAFKRRAQAILSFVGYAVKAVSGVTSTETETSLVSLLVVMATFKSGQGADARVDDINKVARSSLDKTLRVMSASDYIKSTTKMLQSSEQMVQIGALDLLAERLLQVSDHVRQASTKNMVSIVQRIKELLAAHPGSTVAISAFGSLKTIGAGLCVGEESALGEVVPLLLSAIVGRKMAVHALPALAPLAARLGPRIIPFFREIVGQCVAILQEGSEDLSLEATNVLHGLLTSIPTFWAAGEISQVITLYITQRTKDASLASLVKAITKKAPEKVVIPTITQTWSTLLKSSASTATYDMFFDVVRRALRTSSKAVVQENLRAIFNMFLEAFDAMKVDGELDFKASTVTAFTELIVNINENSFKPLFRRLYDWAFVSNTESKRKIVFCLAFSALLDYFKALMTPYMSFVLEEFVAYWKTTSTSGANDPALWFCILTTVTKSMIHDDGVFWQDEKIKQVYGPLVAQVPVGAHEQDESKALLQDTICAIIDSATDDLILKSINVDLLMHTRSEDVQVRLYALLCSKAMWQAHGGKLLGFVSETSTFIAECSEDENDMVCREALHLKTTIESVAGTIEGL